MENLESNVAERYFERNLRTWRRVLTGPFPDYNCPLPPSLHLMLAVVGCKSAEEFEFHVYPCGGYRYSWLWQAGEAVRALMGRGKESGDRRWVCGGGCGGGGYQSF